jgi:hypothetical protein
MIDDITDLRRTFLKSYVQAAQLAGLVIFSGLQI